MLLGGRIENKFRKMNLDFFCWFKKFDRKSWFIHRYKSLSPTISYFNLSLCYEQVPFLYQYSENYTIGLPW